MNQYYNTRYTFDKGRKRVWMAICHYLQKYIPKDAAIMDIGAGYCDFINNIVGGTKYAVDCNISSKSFCNADIHFINADINDIDTKNKVDVIFMSNLLEHFNDVQLDNLFSKLSALLNPNGKIILIQPNYYYAYRSYWDDYTHVKAFSHNSLSDYCISQGYNVVHIEKKFLPFTMKSCLPKSYFLTWLYLKLAYRPNAGQMLLILEKGDHCEKA